MIRGFFSMDFRVKSPRAWRSQRPTLFGKIPWGFLNKTKHQQILNARNKKTSKLQQKNQQDRASRIEPAVLGFQIPLVNFILLPALAAAWVDILLGGLLGPRTGDKVWIFGVHTNKRTNKCCTVCGWGVGAEGMVKRCTNPRRPGNNIKCSQIAFTVTCIAVSLGHLRAQLLGLPAQSSTETCDNPLQW